MVRLIYRQRRRLLVSGFFAALTTILFVSSNIDKLRLPDTAPAWILPATVILTGLAVGLIVMALVVLLILFIRDLRFEAEMLSLGAFLIMLAHILLPRALLDMQWTQLAIILAVFIPLQLTLYGPLLDRFRIRLDHNATRRFRSPRSPEVLWQELVPGAAPVPDHWDTLLVRADPDPEDEDSLIVQYRIGPSIYQHQTQTTLESDRPSHHRYYFQGEVNPANRDLCEGTFDITISPDPKTGGSRVRLEEHRKAMLPRDALLGWFDDTLGDMTDHIAATHAGRRDWSIAGRVRRRVGRLA